MDDLICDPEMAPQIFKLLKDKLSELRKALEETQRDNGDLRAEVARLQDTESRITGARNPQHDLMKNIHCEFEDKRKVGHRLEGENAQIRELLEGCKDEGLINGERDAYSRMGEMECLKPGCEAHVQLLELQNTIIEMGSRLDQQIIVYNDSQERVVELEEQLKQNAASNNRRQTELEDKLAAQYRHCNALERQVQELTRTNEDLRDQRQQSRMREKELEKKSLDIQQKLDLVTNKYWKYKTLSQANGAQTACTSAVQQAVPSAPPPPVRSSEPARAAQGHACTDRGSAGKSVSQDQWRELVENVLRNPCLPPHETSAPFHFPPEVKQHIAPGTILSCPNRVLYPLPDGCAKLVSPVSRFKSTAAPTETEEPMLELVKHAGMHRELFYHTDNGICYAGTFAAGEIGDVSKEEYAGLPKYIKEAVLRLTFPSKNEFLATSRAGIDRVRSMYHDGGLRTQYLPLRYIGHNQPLADALDAMRAAARARRQHGPARSPRSERARSPAGPARPGAGRSRSPQAQRYGEGERGRPVLRGCDDGDRAQTPSGRRRPGQRARTPYASPQRRSDTLSMAPYPADERKTQTLDPRVARRDATPPRIRGPASCEDELLASERTCGKRRAPSVSDRYPHGSDAKKTRPSTAPYP